MLCLIIPRLQLLPYTVHRLLLNFVGSKSSLFDLLKLSCVVKVMECIFWRYVQCTSAFTVIHKVPLVWNGTLEFYDYEKRSMAMRPILLGEKLCIVLLSIPCSPWLAPKLIFDDLNALDILWRGDSDVVNYDQKVKKTIIDFLFL